MLAQLDLFAAPPRAPAPRPAAPPPPDLASLLPRQPSPAWRRYLDAAWPELQDWLDGVEAAP